MQHQLGEISLVRWQGRRNSRLKPGLSAWTLFLSACAVVGALTLLAQAFGLLPLTGPSALAPAGLTLFALGAQFVAITRALLAWITG